MALIRCVNVFREFTLDMWNFAAAVVLIFCLGGRPACDACRAYFMRQDLI